MRLLQLFYANYGWVIMNYADLGITVVESQQIIWWQETSDNA